MILFAAYAHTINRQGFYFFVIFMYTFKIDYDNFNQCQVKISGESVLIRP